MSESHQTVHNVFRLNMYEKLLTFDKMKRANFGTLLQMIQIFISAPVKTITAMV